MSNTIKKVPLAIVGLFLALLTTGNLVLSYGEVYRNIFGVLGGLVLILVLLKMIMYPKIIKAEFENPLVASVFPTFFMGLMLLSTYIKPYFNNLAFPLWILAIVLHAIYILIFTKNYILNFEIKKVFPSYFIVYVGIVVASVTAPLFQQIQLGKIIFWFGLISYFLLIPMVLFRVIKIKDIPEMAMPSIAIFAAPLSLCLAGYMNSFQEKNILMINALLILSTISFIGVLIKLPKLLKTKFYPSFSAFTFPLAITALSLKLTHKFLVESNGGISFLKYLVLFEETIAILIVLYVFISYCSFILLSKSLDHKKVIVD